MIYSPHDENEKPDQLTTMFKLIEDRGLSKTIDLAAEYCRQQADKAKHKQNQYETRIWRKRYALLLDCADNVWKTT